MDCTYATRVLIPVHRTREDDLLLAGSPYHARRDDGSGQAPSKSTVVRILTLGAEDAERARDFRRYYVNIHSHG